MIKYKLNRRPSQSKDNSVRSKAQIKRREREKSSVRSKVEHVFGVVKGLLRYRKTRYKGLRKQTAKLNIMFALANLILADRPHLAAWFSAPWRTWWVTCTNPTTCHSFYGNGALIVRCCLKQIAVEHTLQKLSSSGVWNNVSGANWSKASNSRSVILSSSKSDLSSGTYRLKSVFTLTTKNGNTETITVYSSKETV